MKIALRISRENLEAYSDPRDLRADWELIHLGNGYLSDEAVAATEAQVLVADAITPVSASLIKSMPSLRLIHSQGVAFDRIDCIAAREQGVFVCNNAGVNAAAVAEHTVMLMLAALRQLIPSQNAVFSGDQIQYKGQCFFHALPELLGKSVGLIGFGAIGREVAARLIPFGCKVYFYKPSKGENITNAEALPLDELLGSCDIISLHAPVTDSTRGMIGSKALAMMKPGAVLINTARGALIDAMAVKQALADGTLGFYATDTLDPEPVAADNLLLTMDKTCRDKFLCTPHIAGLTQGSFRRTYKNIWRNTASVQDGLRPDYIVNGL